MRDKTILVVDDHAPTREAYSAFLSGCGYRVMEATHGGEAIMLARRDPPDVVLMDLVMPVLGGVETAESLREYDSTAYIRIIGITACASLVEQDRMRRVCDELLLKPCAPELITERIESLVGRLPDDSPRAVPPAASSRPSGTMRAAVLIVEDNADNQVICRTILEHVGFDVLQAWDGEAGIRMARERKPRLILMDLALPGMDGVEATRRLKSDAATRCIPVVALTAHAGLEDRLRALEAGCIAYLVKPVTPSQVLEEARRWA